jgi:hypothetical protein
MESKMTADQAFEMARESARTAKDQAATTILAKGEYLVNLVDTLRGNGVNESVTMCAVEIYMANINF